MSLIKADKISYTYPVIEDEDFEETDRKSVQGEDGTLPDRQDSAAEEDRPKAQAVETNEPVKALDNVSMEISEGEFVCILGRNGSGKSTFARHLNALIVPDEGTLWVDKMDSRSEEDVWNIRSDVGMVFQNPDNQIVASVVEEDVAFGPENLGVASDRIVKDVAESLAGVGMTDFAKSSPNKLSGGQKQRVAIAGILAMHPKCIVLDESTAMLDPRGRAEVMSTVQELNKKYGITVISITHYMDEALMADRIYVMAGGHVVMEGTPREIFSRPEELEGLGLRLPQISHLAFELKKAGADIPDGILSCEELENAILRLLGR